MANTKRIGNIGEAKTLAKFVEYNIPVFIPFGDNEKVDLIAEFNGKLQKIQCKTSEKSNSKGIMCFSLVSSSCHRNKGKKHYYTQNEIDYWSFYNIENDILLLVPFDAIKENKNQICFSLIYKQSRNQYKTLNWKDFTFDKVLGSEA